MPVERLEVHQHRAARVGDVGRVDPSVGPAGEVPQHPGVHVAEHQLTGFRLLLGAVDVVEQPADLRAAEVRRQRKSHILAQPVDALVAGELADEVARAGVLPDDRVVNRLTALAIPHDRRLTLVGDPDRLDVARLGRRGGERPADHLARARPDLLGVVLDPAGLEVDLLVLALVDVDDLAV
jgi:hypothetical protein